MKMIKVSDYIADFLVEHGITHNFTVTGGGAMHLNDSLGHKAGLTCVYNNHEQACAIAAEAYARLSGRLACVCVTSGPGGTNAITGVMGGWVDSIPMLVISGQVKREMTISAYPDLNLRQLGDQEFNIVDTVRHFTKYSVMITKTEDVAYHLEKAVFLALDGKRGPVWIDVPLDVQGARIDADSLKHFDSIAEGLTEDRSFPAAQAERLADLIRNAKRPLLLAGSGVHYGNAAADFLRLADKLKLPVVTAWAANDILGDDSEYFIGVPGTVGTRAANFAVQKCDLLITLGCRMNVRMVGYNKGDFARSAYKVMVDICADELSKPTFVPDWGICADVKSVIEGLLAADYAQCDNHSKWLNWCRSVKAKYPPVLPEYHKNTRPINPYVFSDELYKKLDGNDIIVCSNGSSCVIPIQVSGFKQGQRLICNSGCAAMGYGLPAAIGAAVAADGKRVICLEGDGSIMMNLQELATAQYYGLNLKIFIFNNDGYHSIRQSQTNSFNSRFVGVNGDSGVALPKFEKIAKAFDIPYYAIKRENDAADIIANVLSEPAVAFCEVFVDVSQNFAPKSSSKIQADGSIVSPSIDEMSPFLSADEYDAVKNSL